MRTSASTPGSALRGSATYTGAADGQYAMAHTSHNKYEGGHFTAIANLAAGFDADSTFETPAANDRSGIAISGMIDNFATGDVPRPDWMVTPMADSDRSTDGMQPLVDPRASIVGDAADADTAGVQSVLTPEWSTGGIPTATGTRTATFHGGGDDETSNSTLPVAATGTRTPLVGVPEHTRERQIGPYDLEAGEAPRC